MKLIYCEHCHDLFKIGSDTFRTCECGRVKGRYINDEEAEVNPEAISIAIGNRSLAKAIEGMKLLQANLNYTAEYEDYRELGFGAIDHAWVRPNCGPGNPHTRLLVNEAKQRCTRERQFVTPANLLSGMEDGTRETEQMDRTDTSADDVARQEPEAKHDNGTMGRLSTRERIMLVRRKRERSTE